MNGSIPCRLLVFELYAGTRRKPAAEPSTEAPADSPAEPATD
jgi:hypothetical protein